MALPTLDKTWNFSVNNIYPAADSALNNFRDFWFGIVDYFISSGWTVPASCRYNVSTNNFTAGSGNLWLTKENLGWGAYTYASTPRSWIVLNNPVNNSQFLIDLFASNGPTSFTAGNNNQPTGIYLSFSRSGYNTSSPTTVPPAPVVSGDTIVLYGVNVDTFGTAWYKTGIQRFVRHSMSSTDGHSMRQIVYCQDYPVFGLFLDTPKDPAPGWSPTSPTPSIAMVFNSSGLSNCFGTSIYTGTPLQTRFGTNGVNAVNLSLYLSGESYSTNLLTNGLNVPNDFTGEYPMVPMGIISTTGPFRGKLGKMSDLWFGISNFVGPVAYPGDSSRQFAQHGTIITPWNGSNIVTR